MQLLLAILFGLLINWSAAIADLSQKEHRILDHAAELEIEIERDYDAAVQGLENLKKSLDPQRDQKAFLLVSLLLTPNSNLAAFEEHREALLRVFESQDYRVAIPALMSMTSIIAHAGRSRDDVLTYYQKGLDACDKWLDPFWCGRLYAHLAAYYYEINDFAMGLRFIKKAVPLLETLEGNRRYYLHNARTTLTVLLDQMGFTAQVVAMKEANLIWYKENGFVSDVALEANNVANRLLSIQPLDHDQIKKYLDMAENAAHENDDQFMLNHNRYARAKYLLALNQYKDSLQLMSEARQYFRKIKNQKFSAVSSLYMAKAALGANQINLAEQELQAVRDKISDDYQYEKLFYLNVETDLARMQGNWPRAFSFQQQYQKFFATMKEDQEDKQKIFASVELALVNEQQKVKELELENIQKERQIKANQLIQGLALGAGFLGILATLFAINTYRQGRQITLRKIKMERILTSIRQGLISFDAQQKIDPEYAKEAENILETDSLQNQNVRDLLWKRSNLTPETLSMIDEVIQNTIGWDQLAWELNSPNLPKELEMRTDRTKFLNLRWAPILDTHGVTQHILLAMEDVTEGKALNALVARQSSLLKEMPQKLGELLSCPPHFRLRFFQEAQALMDPSVDKKKLHTLKGQARSLGLKALSHTIHELESALSAATHVSEKHEELVSQLKEYLSFQEILQKADTSTEKVPSLLQILEKHWETLKNACETHALAWDKLSVEEASGPWSRAEAEVISDICLHIFNNILDHGFLRPRNKTWTPPPLQLHISLRHTTEKGRRLEIFDNGYGLQEDAIRAVAKARSIPQADGETWEDLVFSEGFSTADQVSETSGRGVGLSAVKALAKELHGHVSLRNRKEQKGTHFVLEWTPPGVAASEAMQHRSA